MTNSIDTDRITLALAQAKALIPEAILMRRMLDHPEAQELIAWIQNSPASLKRVGLEAGASELSRIFSQYPSTEGFWLAVIQAVTADSFPSPAPAPIPPQPIPPMPEQPPVPPVSQPVPTPLELPKHPLNEDKPISATKQSDDTWQQPFAALADKLKAVKDTMRCTWPEMHERLVAVGMQGVTFNHMRNVTNHASSPYRPTTWAAYNEMRPALDLLEESLAPIAKMAIQMSAPVVQPAVVEAEEASPANMQIPVVVETTRNSGPPTSSRERISFIEEKLQQHKNVSINSLARELSIGVGTVSDLMRKVSLPILHVGNGVYSMKTQKA
jgi:hypothetical protein